MSIRDDVLRQAMALPAEDRAFVVTNLERSLSIHGGGSRCARQPGAELLARAA
jgi:hypothetical protein